MTMKLRKRRRTQRALRRDLVLNIPAADPFVPRKHNAPPALGALDDQQVLTVPEWCALNGVSLRTGRCILAGGNGPIVTQLSAKRVGVTRGNNRRWQESRAVRRRG
jgi:hypothetical protein